MNKLSLPKITSEPIIGNHSILSLTSNSGYENITELHYDIEGYFENDHDELFSIDKDLQVNVFKALNTAIGSKVKQGAYQLINGLFEDPSNIEDTIFRFNNRSSEYREKTKKQIKLELTNIVIDTKKPDGSINYEYLLKYCLYHSSMTCWTRLNKYVNDSKDLILPLSHIGWLIDDRKNSKSHIIKLIIDLLSYRVVHNVLKFN